MKYLWMLRVFQMNLQSQICRKLSKIFMILATIFILGAIILYFVFPYQIALLCVIGAFWSVFGSWWNGKFIEEDNGKD